MRIICADCGALFYKPPSLCRNGRSRFCGRECKKRNTRDRRGLLLTADRVRELLSYDPSTGIFRWRLSRRPGVVDPGDVAGYVGRYGYRAIGIDGWPYQAHRVAHLHMTGRWPSDQIDHRNGQRDDNRWSNLREANASQNQMNRGPSNSIGLKGVCERRGRFQAQIRRDGKSIFLGLFTTAEAAHAAYCAAAARWHGEFARTA